MDIDSQNIKDSIEDTMRRKITAEKNEDIIGNVDFVFATYINNENQIRIVIQERAKFYSSGLDLRSTEFINNTFNQSFIDTGFTTVKENELIFSHKTCSELSVIRILKNLGINYDFNLESEFIK
jgi:hypothetical protein